MRSLYLLILNIILNITNRSYIFYIIKALQEVVEVAATDDESTPSVSNAHHEGIQNIILTSFSSFS